MPGLCEFPQRSQRRLPSFAHQFTSNRSIGEENIVCRYTVLAALCMTAGAASAGELDALQGGSVYLGAFGGVVYYTEEEDG